MNSTSWVVKFLTRNITRRTSSAVSRCGRKFVQDCGAWGWAVVIGLLIGDLFLPIPATGVMSAAGYVYGPWIGGIISVTGSFLSGDADQPQGVIPEVLGERVRAEQRRPDQIPR